MGILGVKFDGKALVFDAKMYEHPFITLADNVLVDQSPGIVGHYGIYDKITVGPCKVGGVIHHGTFVANGMVTSEESGPWRSVVGTYDDNFHPDAVVVADNFSTGDTIEGATESDWV